MARSIKRFTVGSTDLKAHRVSSSFMRAAMARDVQDAEKRIRAGEMTSQGAARSTG
jgi:hypothetical protein